MAMLNVTCAAPVNIAVLKYWGKRDEALLLPLHASLSATLSIDDMKTTTSAATGPSIKVDRIWLNGKYAPSSLPYICPFKCFILQ